MVVGEADVGARVGEDVKVDGVVVVAGVAVEDVDVNADVDVDDAGGVRPPQTQAPSVPRGIYKRKARQSPPQQHHYSLPLSKLRPSRE